MVGLGAGPLTGMEIGVAWVAPVAEGSVGAPDDLMAAGWTAAPELAGWEGAGADAGCAERLGTVAEVDGCEAEAEAEADDGCGFTAAVVDG